MDGTRVPALLQVPDAVRAPVNAVPSAAVAVTAVRVPELTCTASGLCQGRAPVASVPTSVATGAATTGRVTGAAAPAAVAAWRCGSPGRRARTVPVATAPTATTATEVSSTGLREPRAAAGAPAAGTGWAAVAGPGSVVLTSCLLDRAGCPL